VSGSKKNRFWCVWSCSEKSRLCGIAQVGVLSDVPSDAAVFATGQWFRRWKLPHYLTLHDITQKPKRDIDELKQRLINTWNRIPQAIIDEAIYQWQTRLRACVKANGHHFEHLLWSTATQPALFRATSDTPKPVLLQSHSHYWEEDVIAFRFLCNVR